MEYTILKELVDDGLSTYKIAEKLNISQTNVRLWLKKFNLKTNITRRIENGGECEICKKPLVGKQVSFCSKKCKSKKYGYGSYKNQKKRRKERKSELVEKLGGKCSVCGYSKNMASFSFHHVNQEDKTENISKILHYKLSYYMAEAGKCILLCENCHREKHREKQIANSYKKQRDKINNKRGKLLDILGGKCSKCGYDKNISALDFHHVGNKKYRLSLREMASAIPMEELIEEVNKCIILCANCHLEEHQKERT